MRPHLKFELFYLASFVLNATAIARSLVSSAFSERQAVAFDASSSSRRVTSTRERALQQPASTGRCRVCPVPGSTLLEHVVPTIHRTTSLGVDGNIDFWTCREWDSYTAVAGENGSALSAASKACVDLHDSTMRSCCDGLPPLYSCTADVLKEILHEDYRSSVPPITNGKAIDIEIVIEMEDVDIVDYGLDGGAIEILAQVRRNWIDPRLSWNDSETGCTSVEVSDAEIWTPSVFDDSTHTAAMVLADGRVSWTRMGKKIASCKTQDDGAKICTTEYKEIQHIGYDINYFSQVIRSPSSMTGILAEEYRFNKDLSGVVTSSSDVYRENERPIVLSFYFDPRNRSCNICGHGSATLTSNAAQYVPEGWKQVSGAPAGVGCNEVDAFLAKHSITDHVCEIGRAYFEEACCDDVESSFECESNIHDTIVDELNTISPPDPSPLENDFDFQSRDFVDVVVLLDVLHIFEIDIKSSSISLLVAIELNWYDDRLSWEPFIGGCHRVSYRASIDAEITEIWVPEIELLNQVEGIQTLPEAHASVYFDGHVSWRRTGVLKASCALTGVEDFPFDRTGCFLEFGGTRDPLYHRIKYVSRAPEFSERVRNPSGFQEYRMFVNETTVTHEFEDMSGFWNEVIRFQFYFSRASKHYVTGFILLYILFTYLSFGMFLVDYNMGERLGYGSSILFVIVAQDITMSEITPITNDVLWIYKLSFGSKIFVVTGIIQSLVVLYIFSYHDPEEDNREDISPTDEEIRPFINETVVIEPVDSQDKECAHIGNQTLDVNGVSKRNHSEGNVSCEDESVQSAKPSRWKELGGKCTSCQRWILEPTEKCTCCKKWILRRDLVIMATDSPEAAKIKKLRRADWATALVSIFIYSIFVAIMFAAI